MSDLLLAEVGRLEAILRAVRDHGMTMWSDTSCGRGGLGGQAFTTTTHLEAIEALVAGGLKGLTLTEIADSYATMWGPEVSRLDEPARSPRRAGRDGRPV